MPYQITLSEDGAYIIGKVTDALDISVAEGLAREYASIIESTGIHRILNDVRGVPNRMLAAQNYHYAYRNVKLIGLPQGIRSAILVDEGDSSHDFQETVARNAGYDVRLFNVYDEAVRWLLSDDHR